MTDISQAADNARDKLDETTAAIESASASDHPFDPAIVPGLQQSMDRAKELADLAGPLTVDPQLPGFDDPLSF